MEIRTAGKWLLLFCGFCLVLCGSSRQLCAGQDYPSQVKVFGNSTPAPAPAPPQKIDPAEEADIQQLMELAGTKATITRMMDEMEQSMRPLLLRAFPPGAYREQLVQLFLDKLHSKIDAQHLLDLAAPIYAQHFTDAEIKQMIDLFKTPVVQKWISLQPEVHAQLGPAAHEWGRQMGVEAMREVLQEHPELAQQLNAAAHAAHQR